MSSSPASAETAAYRRRIDAWPAPLRALIALLSGHAPPVRLDDRGWDRFLRLAIDRHRVAPMVLEGAAGQPGALPARIAGALTAEARANAAAALRQKAESLRLLTALEAEDIRPVILKGWPLAEQLYGAAGLRHAKDLDIYIEPGEIDRSCAALGRLGYRVDEEHEGRVPDTALPAFRAEYNDLCFYHDAAETQVEVHWRNYHFRGWPELRDLPRAFTDHVLDATGHSVRRLSAPAALLYLSLHGQQHLWLRLKWLLDVDLLVRRRTGEELLADLEFARAAGAGRPVLLAVHLAHSVFESPLPRGWPAAGRGDARALARFASLIASERVDPGSIGARLEYYRTAFRLAETAEQRRGVVRYLVWRRLRLGPLRGRLAPT